MTEEKKAALAAIESRKELICNVADKNTAVRLESGMDAAHI